MILPQALQNLYLLEWTKGQKITVSADHIERSLSKQSKGAIFLKFVRRRPVKLASFGGNHIDAVKRKDVMKIFKRRNERIDYFAVTYNIDFVLGGY